MSTTHETATDAGKTAWPTERIRDRTRDGRQKHRQPITQDPLERRTLEGVVRRHRDRTVQQPPR